MQKISSSYALNIYKDSFSILSKKIPFFLFLGILGTIVLFIPFLGNLFYMIILGLFINLTYAIANGKDISFSESLNLKPLISNKVYLNLTLLYFIISSAWEFGILRGVMPTLMSAAQANDPSLIPTQIAGLAIVYLILKLVILLMFLIAPVVALQLTHNTSIKESVMNSLKLIITSPTFTLLYIISYLFVYAVSIYFTATLLLFILLPILSINSVLIWERSK